MGKVDWDEVKNDLCKDEKFKESFLAFARDLNTTIGQMDTDDVYDFCLDNSIDISGYEESD